MLSQEGILGGNLLKPLAWVNLATLRSHSRASSYGPLMRQRLIQAMMFMVAFSLPASAWADLYKYRTADGEVIISNTPRDDLKLIEVVMMGGSSSQKTTSRKTKKGSTVKTARSEKAARNIGKAERARRAHLSNGRARRALSKTSKLTRKQRERAYDDIIREAAKAYEMPFAFIKGVIKVESAFNAQALSVAGAQGLMQLMPATAKGLGVTDPFDPRQNIFGGTKMLRQLNDKYDGDINLIMAAYNAGPGNVARYNGIPWTQTRAYVASVYHWYKVYAAKEQRK